MSLLVVALVVALFVLLLGGVTAGVALLLGRASKAKTPPPVPGPVYDAGRQHWPVSNPPMNPPNPPRPSAPPIPGRPQFLPPESAMGHDLRQYPQ